MINTNFLCILIIFCWTPSTWSQINDIEIDRQCAPYWVQFGNSCYKFVKSPIRPRNEASRNCQVCIVFNTFLKFKLIFDFKCT